MAKSPATQPTSSGVVLHEADARVGDRPSGTADLTESETWNKEASTQLIALCVCGWLPAAVAFFLALVLTVRGEPLPYRTVTTFMCQGINPTHCAGWASSENRDCLIAFVVLSVFSLSAYAHAVVVMRRMLRKSWDWYDIWEIATQGHCLGVVACVGPPVLLCCCVCCEQGYNPRNGVRAPATPPILGLIDM